MTEFYIAPFALSDVVHPKARTKSYVQDGYRILAMKVDRVGWSLQLEGLSIGDHGWFPADDFESANPHTRIDQALSAVQSLRPMD